MISSPAYSTILIPLNPGTTVHIHPGILVFQTPSRTSTKLFLYDLMPSIACISKLAHVPPQKQFQRPANHMVRIITAITPLLSTNFLYQFLFSLVWFKQKPDINNLRKDRFTLVHCLRWDTIHHGAVWEGGCEVADHIEPSWSYCIYSQEEEKEEG